MHSALRRSIRLAAVFAMLVPALCGADCPETPNELLADIQRKAWCEDWGVNSRDLDDLAELQRKHYIDWCAKQHDKIVSQTTQSDQHTTKIKSACANDLEVLPTPYQDPMKFQIVRSRFKEIHSVAQKMGLAIDYSPLLGSSPSGESNARAIRKCGHRLLVVNDGLIDLGWGIAKIVTLALPDVKSRLEDPFGVTWNRVEKHLKENPEVYHRFNDLMNAARSRDFRFFHGKFLLDQQSYRFANAVGRGVELFLLGHEYAHHSHGHLQNKLRGRPLGALASKPIKLGFRDIILPPSVSFRKEFDADQASLYFAARAVEQQELPNDVALFGGILALRTMELTSAPVGTRRNVCGADKEDPSGHPSFDCRVLLLRQHALDSPKAQRDIDLIEQILDHLWTHYSPQKNRSYRVRQTAHSSCP